MRSLTFRKCAFTFASYFHANKLLWLYSHVYDYNGNYFICQLFLWIFLFHLHSDEKYILLEMAHECT